jgi:hypothetical protein
MKRIIIIITFVLFGVELYAQTGINITAPQQGLHVAGTTSSTTIGTASNIINIVKPTIRIEGLNGTNNSVFTVSANNPSSLVQAISVTQDGDLILAPNAVIPLVSNLPGTDGITTPVTLTVAVPADTIGVMTKTLKTYVLTLNQSSMVHFLASVSVSILDAAGGKLVDTKNKICFSGYRFTAVPAGSGIALNTTFGSESANYINNATSGVSGTMYLQPEAYYVLPKGSYTVILVGQVFGSGQLSYSGVFGQATDDMVSIVVTPL